MKGNKHRFLLALSAAAVFGMIESSHATQQTMLRKMGINTDPQTASIIANLGMDGVQQAQQAVRQGVPPIVFAAQAEENQNITSAESIQDHQARMNQNPNLSPQAEANQIRQGQNAGGWGNQGGGGPLLPPIHPQGPHVPPPIHQQAQAQPGPGGGGAMARGGPRGGGAPRGGRGGGGPVVGNTPLGAAIYAIRNQLTAPAMTRADAEAASAAITALGVATIQQKIQAGRNALQILPSLAHLQGGDFPIINRSIESFLVRSTLNAGNEQTIFDQIMALNIPALTPTVVGNIATQAVVAHARGDTQIQTSNVVVLIAHGVLGGNMNAPQIETRVSNIVTALLYPPPPVVGVATANVGDQIGGAQAQRIADIHATIVHHGVPAIQNAVNADPVALAVFNALNATHPNDALAAAYAVLTSPAGTNRINRINRATDMLQGFNPGLGAGVMMTLRGVIL